MANFLFLECQGCYTAYFWPFCLISKVNNFEEPNNSPFVVVIFFFFFLVDRHLRSFRMGHVRRSQQKVLWYLLYEILIWLAPFARSCFLLTHTKIQFQVMTTKKLSRCDADSFSKNCITVHDEPFAQTWVHLDTIKLSLF